MIGARRNVDHAEHGAPRGARDRGRPVIGEQKLAPRLVQRDAEISDQHRRLHAEDRDPLNDPVLANGERKRDERERWVDARDERVTDEDAIALQGARVEVPIGREASHHLACRIDHTGCGDVGHAAHDRREDVRQPAAVAMGQRFAEVSAAAHQT